MSHEGAYELSGPLLLQGIYVGDQLRQLSMLQDSVQQQGMQLSEQAALLRSATLQLENVTEQLLTAPQ